MTEGASAAEQPVRLAVSIVLYRTDPAELARCLQSLALYPGEIRLFLVDNSPTDALRGQIATGLPLDYRHNPSNPGFGAGHNIAIRQALAEGFTHNLVINADVRFDADILSPMLAHMQAHPEVGQMMPLILNPDGTVQRLCKLVPTPADLLFRRFLSGERKAASNRRFELHASGYDRMMFVPYLSGCFMLFSAAALREVGLFDERYFMYPEDIDLTRRMAERYETLFFPQVRAVHAHGAASHKSLKMFAIHAINIARYFNKWGWVSDPGRDALNRKTLAQFEGPTPP
jgi:GT2 family glycosyltransferase